LDEPDSSARVLATFDDVWDLETPAGEVLAVVTPSIGDGPLNVVVGGEYALSAAPEPGDPAWLGLTCLKVGALEIGLAEAAVWEPRPDWAALRACWAKAGDRVSKLRRICEEEGAGGSLLALLDQPQNGHSVQAIGGAAAQQAVRSLKAGWAGDRSLLLKGAQKLAGLGGGLTPSGDDFLAGLMLWAWLAHPNPDAYCRAILEAAEGRTTTLSAAFLRAAARGECSARWHSLLTELLDIDERSLRAAARGVISHGATSGADAVAGFVLMRSAL
jgi:hypothetical protein